MANYFLMHLLKVCVLFALLKDTEKVCFVLYFVGLCGYHTIGRNGVCAVVVLMVFVPMMAVLNNLKQSNFKLAFTSNT